MISVIIEGQKNENNQYTKERKLKKLLIYTTLALMLFGLPFIAYTQEVYVGAKKCKMCHIKIHKKWQTVGHSKAFESLKPGVKPEVKKKAGLDPQKDYTADAACVECHTTGNDVTRPGIQCEACHAPGKGFTKPTIMNKKKWKANPDVQRKLALEAGLVIAPDEAFCRTCHNEKSPTFKAFDFHERYEEIKHKK